MSAPLDAISSLMQEADAGGSSRLQDSLLQAQTVDSEAFNAATRQATPGTTPQQLIERPGWQESKQAAHEAGLIEERPRLRAVFERQFDLAPAVSGRVEGIARAHDSLDPLPSPLVRQSGGLFGEIGDTAAATRDQFQSTLWQYKAAGHANLRVADALFGTNLGGAANNARMREAVLAIAENQQTLERASFPGQMIALGVSQAPNVVVGVGARVGGAAVAGPVGAAVLPFLAMGGLEGGVFAADAFLSMPEVPDEDIATMALVVGAANGALEMVPLGTAFDTMAGKLKRDAMKLLADRNFRDYTLFAIRRILTQSAAEGGTEALQEIPGALVPELHRYMEGEIGLGEALSVLGDEEFLRGMGIAAMHGAMGAPVVAGGSLAIGAVGFKNQVAQAQSNRELFQGIADAAVDNRELIDQMPERYQKLMDDSLDEDGQIEGIYIDPARLVDAVEPGSMEYDALFQAIPDLPARMAAAEQVGGKVRFTAGEFATFVAPSEVFNRLGDDLSFAVDQESLREAVELSSPEAIEQVKARLEALRGATGIDPEQDRATEEDFGQTLAAIFEETMPAVSAPVRERNATLLARMVSRIAEMGGQDPLEAAVAVLDRAQFEQRRELDSPGELARSQQVLREGGDGEVLGQPVDEKAPAPSTSAVDVQQLAAHVDIADATESADFGFPTSAAERAELIRSSGFRSRGRSNAMLGDETFRQLKKGDVVHFFSPDDYEARGSFEEMVVIRDGAFPKHTVTVTRDGQPVSELRASISEPDVLRQPVDEKAPKNSNEHLLMVQREEREVGDTGSVKWFKGERGLIKANAKKIAKKIRGDGKRPSKKQVDAVVQQIETYVAFEKARHPPVAGWTSWEYAKSEPKKDDDGKVKLDKEGNVVFQHQPKKQPYQFDKDKKGKALKKGARTRAVRSLANRVHEEIRKVAARAASGDAAANVHIRQAKWYREMRATLRRDFGGLGDLFADLLGATSPQTPVRANWTNASEALSMASSGEFDSLIDQWEAWVEGIENAEQAFLEWIADQKSAGWQVGDLKETGQYKRLKADMSEIRSLPDHLNPRKRNGKKFGANGKQVVKTMVNLWRTVKKPDTSIGRGSTAPKAQNFSGNLIGFREGATIDVWAARFLQRLRWGNKIPSKAEGGVQGDVLPGGETTGQFRFGQDVFEAAAELIRNDSDLAGVESFANMNPDDLQAVVWFVEKEVWTIADATSGEGEGGSFEFESWLAGSTQFERIDELRTIIGAKRSTLPEKEAARQELELFERRLDRFTAGLSLETGAWLQGVNFSPDDGEMAAVSARLLDAIHSTDPDRVFVVGSKTASTVGLYGEPERSFDLEIVAREGYDFGAFRRRVFEEARDAHQDSAFVSRVLRDGEDIDYKRHRPGIEVYFRESKPLSEIDPILAELTKILPAGYTVSVDARRSRSAREGEMPSVVGIRAQYIPEFEVRWGDNEQRASPLAGLTEDELASHVRDQGDRMDSQVVRILASVDGVTFAGTLWHETEVVFEGDYDAAIAKGQSNADSSARTRAQDRSPGESGAERGSQFGQPVATGVESAARRIEAVEAAQGRGEIPFGGNAQQPVEAVAGVDRLEQAEAELEDLTQAAVDAFNRRDLDVFRQPAFHGTGSRFDRFSTDFMGTGEGAQAFGWGLYFSSSRKIAEYYRAELVAGHELKPKDFVFPEGLGEAAKYHLRSFANFLHRGADFERYPDSEFIVESAIDWLESTTSDPKVSPKDRQIGAEALAEIRSIDPGSIEITARGQVFKVDIPDDSDLMDWDAPLSEQPEAVRQALSALFDIEQKPLQTKLESMPTDEISAFLSLVDPNGEYDQEDADGNAISEEQWREELISIALSMDEDGELSSYMNEPLSASQQKASEIYLQLQAQMGSDRAASEALAAAGIKGHKYKAGQLSGGAGDATNYVIYDDAAIQIAETFYSKAQEAKSSTRGQLIVDRQIQKFLLQISEEKVNDSTLTHEIFHLALELVLDAAENPGAGQELLEYRDQILAFLGVESRDQIKRDQHERWAESGEVYMASGEAPTPELRNLFRFFFQRFKQVYRSIRDQLKNAGTDAELVPIFDRLLASEDDIRMAANRDYVVAPLLSPELASMMTAGEEQELRERMEKLQASERQRLEATIAREDERIIKAQMGELREEVKREVYGRRVHKLVLWLKSGKTEVGEPIRVFGPSGQPLEEHKMNGEMIDEAAGDVATRKSLPRGTWKREGGLDPARVAQAAGYRSTEEMLAELMEVEDSKRLIAQIVHERAEALGLVATRQELQEAASKKVDWQERDRLYETQRRIAKRLRGALPGLEAAERRTLAGEQAPAVGEAQARVQAAKAALDAAVEQGAPAAEFDALQVELAAAEAGVLAAREARADQAAARREAKTARKKMSTRAIRAAAREIVNEVQFGQLPREVAAWKKLRSKASATQTDAALARDWDGLEAAIDQEQLTNALAEEGARRLEDVKKWKRLIESFDKKGSKKRARLSKHADFESDQDGRVTNVMDVIDGLLEMVSFKNVSLKKLSYASMVGSFSRDVEEQTGVPIPLPSWVDELIERPNYKEMKVRDLEDLYVGIKALEHFGMTLVREREDAAAEAEQAEVEELIGVLESQKPTYWAENQQLDPSQVSGPKKLVGSIIGSHLSFESFADILDDLDPEGAFNRFFVQRFQAAALREEELRRMVSEKINAAWQRYTSAEQREFYNKPILIRELGESLTKNAIMVIAAQMGSEHGRAALRDAKAYPISDAALSEVLSHVTDKDADYLEAVVDAVNLLWEPAAAAEKEINGVVPPKVEASPWQLPSGRMMKGGYFPLAFSADLDERAARDQARDIGKGLMPPGGGAAMTKAGAMKARKATSGGRTVRAEFHAVLQKHVNSMAKDIAWRGTIVRADRQLRKLAQPLKRVFGTKVYKHMQDYLKRQGTPLRQGDQGPPDWILTVAKHARHGLGLSVMAYRFVQAAIQVSGAVTAIPRIGAKNLAWGYADISATGKPWERLDHYRNLIPALRNRAEQFDRDAQAEMLRLHPIDPKRPVSTLEAVRAFSAKYGYMMLGWVDSWAATAVGAGAFHQAMAGEVDGINANDTDAAIRYAGKIVRVTQASGEKVDLPSVLDSGELMKLMTPMMTFVNAQFNQQVVYSALGVRQIGDPMAKGSMVPGVPRDLARLFAAYTFINIVEPIMSESLRYAINGVMGPDEPDEEEFWSVIQWRALFGWTGGIAFAREAEGMFRGFSPNTPVSTLLTTAYNATVKPFIDISEGDFDGGKWLRSLAKATTYATGVPTIQAMNGAEVLMQDSLGRGE